MPRNAAELLSIIPLAFLLAIIGLTFWLYLSFLRWLGLEPALWEAALAWWVVGVPCAFYWPWRYRAGMSRDEWRRNFWHFVRCSLAGPWALLLCFPV